MSKYEIKEYDFIPDIDEDLTKEWIDRMRARGWSYTVTGFGAKTKHRFLRKKKSEPVTSVCPDIARRKIKIMRAGVRLKHNGSKWVATTESDICSCHADAFTSTNAVKNLWKTVEEWAIAEEKAEAEANAAKLKALDVSGYDELEKILSNGGIQILDLTLVGSRTVWRAACPPIEEKYRAYGESPIKAFEALREEILNQLRKPSADTGKQEPAPKKPPVTLDADKVLEKETEVYERNKQGWIQAGRENEVVLICREECSFYSTFQIALVHGYDLYGVKTPFLIRKISRVEPTSFIGVVS